MESFVFPGNIEPEISLIASRPIPYMRTAAFSAVVKSSEQMLLHLIGCPTGKVIFYTASGTGAMDAVVANYVSRYKKIFIISGGSFGDRWKNICDYYNLSSTLYKIPFAKDIDYEDLEKKVASERPEIFLCQHHETSTGQLFDLEKISVLCKKNNVSLVVDAISSFLADPLNMAELGIDICITSSQKGLNIAPGLSFVILSDKLSSVSFNANGYYFDFEENLNNLQRGQTPYSPATTLFLQLHERLKRDVACGVDAIISTVRGRALYFRGLCKKYGWEVPAETPSNCITGFFVKRNGDILFEKMMEKGIYIMPGGTPGYFRVSHLGIQDEKSLAALAETIHQVELL